MVEKRSELELMLEHAFKTHGMDHLETIKHIREYLKFWPEEELMKYIGEETNIYYLRALMEVGIKGEAWNVLTTKIQRIAKEL